MLNIKLICVGKVKEKSMQDMILEYEKRLSKYCKLEIIEIQDEKLTNVNSNTEMENVKLIECQKMHEKMSKFGNCYTIALDLTGKQCDSLEFSQKLVNISNYHSSTIVFIIGGSLGMTDNFLSTCDEKISFSKLTFPHQLIRVFLLEQIFRSFKIQNNETYHH